MSTRLLLLCCLLASAGLSVRAQEPVLPALQGQRVRITGPTRSSPPIVGAFAAVRSDTVFVTGPEGERGVPLAAVARLDVSRGTRSNAGTGALIGAGVLGASLLAVCGDCLGSTESGANFLLVLAPSLVGGALVGALIGGSVHSDRWEPVPLRQLSFRPGLRISLRF